MLDEKEQRQAIVIVDRKSGAQPVVVRVWTARSRSPGASYCSIWAHGPKGSGVHVAGHGRATGWGYHRPSAALAAALDSAGVTLSEAIDGRGESAMIDACKAVAVAAGFKASQLVAVVV